MVYSLDRIEADIAVLVDEDGNDCRIPASALPTGCRPGTVLRQDGGVWTADEALTLQRRQQALQLQNSVCRRRRK